MDTSRSYLLHSQKLSVLDVEGVSFLVKHTTDNINFI